MPMTSTLATSRKRLQRLVRSYRFLVILVVAGTLLHLGRTPNLYRGSDLPQYEPGRLGKFLVGRHEDHKKPEVVSPWHAELLKRPASDSLFTWNDRDDRCDNLNTPEGFELDGNEEQVCWRLRLLHQLDAWTPHKSFSTWKDQEEKNTAALDRLRKCLLRPLSPEPQTYDDDPCSLKTTKIVIGHWWFWTMGFTKAGLSGEAIWTASMIDALEEQGYTVLSTSEYEGMIQAHAEIPDLISHLFIDEKIMLTCMSDPFCLSAEDFRPTRSLFPDLQISANGDPIRTEGMQGNQEGDRQKWVWSQKELEKLDDAADRGTGRARGTIPLHKLFVLTWWGTKTGEGYWPVPDGFSWNPLGPEWTISPFSYPNHTFMPYSIERECSAVPLTPPAQKLDRVFVLAKLAEYFYDKRKAPPESVWENFQQKTGLEPVSVATDRKDGTRGWLNYTVPQGVTAIAPLTRDQFEIEVGKSKVMLGIGRPYISPSIYTSLCQGTPVVLPYFADPEEVNQGYNLFNGEYAQHGPASLIGPPYVYTYQHDDDPQQLLDLVSQAASKPIDRYIPDDMTWSAVRADVDDLMLFDWHRHAEQIRTSRGSDLIPQNRLDVIGRCFEIGRCKPLSPEL